MIFRRQTGSKRRDPRRPMPVRFARWTLFVALFLALAYATLP